MSHALRSNLDKPIMPEDIAMPPIETEPSVEADSSLNLEQLFEEPEQPVYETEPVVEAKPNAAEYNFKALREKAERAERERDDMMRRLQDIERKQSMTQHIEDDVHLNPDDLVEWKHVDKKLRKYEQQLQEYQRQSAVNAAEMRIKSQYPDFESVVTPESVEQLRAMYPELAASVSLNTDIYSQATSAYTLIKKLGIASDTPIINEKARVATNSAKPRPLTSIAPQQADSPLSKANAFANGLTEELQKQLIREMTEARKNR